MEGHPAFVGARAEDGDAVLGDAGIAGDGVDDATLAACSSGLARRCRPQGRARCEVKSSSPSAAVVRPRRRRLGGGRDRLGDVEELVHDGGVDVLQVFRAFVDVVEGGERHVRGETLQRRDAAPCEICTRAPGEVKASHASSVHSIGVLGPKPTCMDLEASKARPRPTPSRGCSATTRVPRGTRREGVHWKRSKNVSAASPWREHRPTSSE